MAAPKVRRATEKNTLSTLAMKTLAEQNLENRARASYDKALAFSTYPQLFDPVFFEPPVVRILMVVDDRGNFIPGDSFSPSILINVLNTSPGPYVQFDVHTASRLPGTVPRFADFRFTRTGDFDLNDYDALWLFGDEQGNDKNLDNDERNLLTNYMKRGRGMFATGDHDQLGRSMCDRVPRVRTMRVWKVDEPIFETSHRHDTLRKGEGDSDELFCQERAERDGIPQEIKPTYFQAVNTLIPGSDSYPHPLLCGPRGTIKFLPDHAHEGACNERPDITDPEEFPQLFGKVLEPLIVARAQVIGGHRTDTIECNGRIDSSTTEGHEFAAIAAYDGHKVKLGRVAVDSSFHHFFNRNLIGLEKTEFFEEIKAYFYNLGVWLAPKEKQRLMFERSLWVIRWIDPLVNALSAIKDESSLETIDWRFILKIGTVARSSLSRLASSCLSLQWTLDLIGDLIAEDARRLLPDPWHPPILSPDVQPLYSSETIVDAALGGAMLQIAAVFPEKKPEIVDKARSELSAIIALGASKGIKAFREYLNNFIEAANNTSRAFEPDK